MKSLIKQEWILREGTVDNKRTSLHVNSDDIYTFSVSFPEYARQGSTKVIKVTDDKYFEVFKAPLNGLWDD